MDRHVTPFPFYGAAIATLAGLAAGLALHGPWQSHAGGPQLLLASAAAAELARPVDETDIIQASIPLEQTAYADIALADMGQIPADPLPLTRLTRSGGRALPAQAEIEPVSADATDSSDPAPSQFQQEMAHADTTSRVSYQSVASVSYNTGAPGF
jgi:hypothetical protein